MLPLTFAGGSAGGGGGGTLTLQPNGTDGIDTYLDEAQPSVNTGASPGMLCTNSSGARCRMLLKFDLSSLVGKTIVSATLSLWSANTMPNPGTFTANRVLSSNSVWNEVEATWDYAIALPTYWDGDIGEDGGADGGCSQSGVDYSATELGHSTTAGQAANTEIEFLLDPTEFTEMVNSNYGMVIGSSSASISSFRSSDYSTVTTRRPKLVVVYTG